jgi:hypothetical protein
MSGRNPFAPPKAPVVEPRGAWGWFRRRPIPVFIIAAICSLPLIAVLSAFSDQWGGYFRLMALGAMSPLMLVWRLLDPVLLCVAGVALLMLWARVAAVLFAAFLALQLRWFLFGAPASYVGPSLALAFLAYSIWLASRKRSP